MKKYYFIYLLIFSFCGQLYADNSNFLTIIQTTDLHSHIFGVDSGWLRIAHKVREIRSIEGGKSNTLLIDCGDTINGSLSGYLSKGEIAAVMMNSLDYDAWILGNHDFGLGEKRLAEICGLVKADIISGNLKWQENLIKPYEIYSKKDIKVALIGLTSPHLNEWLWGEEAKKFQVDPLENSLDIIIPKVMLEKPDLIVLALHHGRFSPKRLKGVNLSHISKKYPQIDLILGGHSHQETAGEINGVRSWFSASSPHGLSLSKIKIHFNEENKIIEIKSQIIPVSEKTNQDPECVIKTEKWRKKLKHFERKIVGITHRQISGDLLDNLFAEAMISVAATDAAIISSPVKGCVLKGEITEKDLFEIEPYEDKLCVLSLSKREIIAILDEQNKHNIDRKMKIFHTEVNEIDQDKRIAVAFSSYSLAGAGGRFPILKAISEKKECHGKSTGISVRDAVRLYIKKNFKAQLK